MAARGDPIREWREQYARSCLSLDFEPLAGPPFHASVKPVFEEVRVVRTALSPGAVFRDRDLVQDGDDSFGFLISRSRQVEAKHQGRELQLGPGDATMMHASEPGSLGSGKRFGFFEVMIPPAEWDARSARPGDALMGHLRRNSEALRLLRSYIGLLERIKLTVCFEGRGTVRQHLIDLAVVAATRDRPIGESTASAVVTARLATALDRIAASFQDPELSIGAVARSEGISPRYLQRLLESSGRSFTEHVTELRLQRALTLLGEPGPRRIVDVALEAGFSDISHFNRLFRARFGDTPSAVRAIADGKGCLESRTADGSQTSRDAGFSDIPHFNTPTRRV